MTKITLGRLGLEICLYLITGSGSNEVASDLCTFEAHM
jgi:hypothetical protein